MVALKMEIGRSCKGVSLKMMEQLAGHMLSAVLVPMQPTPADKIKELPCHLLLSPLCHYPLRGLPALRQAALLALAHMWYSCNLDTANGVLIRAPRSGDWFYQTCEAVYGHKIYSVVKHMALHLHCPHFAKRRWASAWRARLRLNFSTQREFPDCWTHRANKTPRSQLCTSSGSSTSAA